MTDQEVVMSTLSRERRPGGAAVTAGLSARQQSWVLGWFAGVVALGVASLLIVSWARAEKGRQPQNHPGPVPEGVIQIDKLRYLVQSGQTIAPSTLCRGRDGVTRTRQVASHPPQVYVECYQGQTWNDHRAMPPNFGTALVRTLSDAFWYIPVSAALAILGWLTLAIQIGGVRRKRRERAKILVDREQERRELRAAFARDEITDLEFHTKLDKLYREGVKPAEDD